VTADASGATLIKNIVTKYFKGSDFFSNDMAFGFLTMGLTDEFSWVRYLALHQLAKLDDHVQKTCLESHVQNLLNDQDERVRATIVSMIRYWGVDEHIAMLRSRLPEETASRVRANILEVLLARKQKNLDSGMEVDSLRYLLEDASHRVRTTAAVLLWGDYRKDAKATLWGCLQGQKAVEKSAGIWALSQIRDRDLAIAAFDLVLDDKVDAVTERQVLACFRRMEADGVLTLKDVLSLAKLPSQLMELPIPSTDQAS
jgi:HEAT repeat protein